jgi:hypothetical protein
VNQRKVSARYYLFEEVVEATPGFANLRRRVPIDRLQLLAGLVWAREGGKGSCPPIIPLNKRNGKYSYFLNGKIRLLPKHRNIGSLLHELAHALGTRDKLTHGPAFRARCLRLFKEYGEWSGKVDF